VNDSEKADSAMTPDNHRKNIELLRELLAQIPGCVETDDPVYGKRFQCPFTPCCVPLALLAWVNPDNEGIFVRIVFPAIATSAQRTTSALNEVNVDLPIGVFVLTQSGEVRFKSAVFIGDSVAPKPILEHLFASSADMVRVQYRNVIQILTGSPHEH
jgi:hypothetical protein